MVPFYHLSLTCQSIPHRKAVIPPPPPPRDFSLSANMLFPLTIYVKNIENLSYIASTKKPGYPHFKNKQTNKQPAILFHAARNTSPTHTHTDKTKQSKVSFDLPTFTIAPALGPEASNFSRGCLEDG